ncbi:MAG: NTP transferase domain-containing protein [Clostridia bacterium]|nr:NTP transferase domain-containing protein [Clostridia bacterium]
MKAIILAGGKGKRLNDEHNDLPKALRQVHHKAMLDYVLDSISFCDEIILVVGYKKDAIIEHTKRKYTYVLQTKQLGTGHAALCAWPALHDYNGPVLIAFGDMPLCKEATYRELLRIHEENMSDCTILSSVVNEEVPIPHYGRIIRDQNHQIEYVKEEKDCSESEKQIREVNVGIMICDSQKLFTCLKEVSNKNNQNEYYLTEVPEIMKRKGFKIVVHTIYDSDEIYGANTPEEIISLENILKERQKND